MKKELNNILADLTKVNTQAGLNQALTDLEQLNPAEDSLIFALSDIYGVLIQTTPEEALSDLKDVEDSISTIKNFLNDGFSL